MQVAVVSTGVANTAAVLTALQRAGAEPRLVDDAASIRTARRLVLPGVGAFGAAKDRLDQLGLTAPLAARVRSLRPTLGICLGLQLLAQASDEAPGVDGLGVLPTAASRFPEGPRCPHLGWNRVEGGELVEPGAAWFAHSYRLTEVPDGWTPTWAEHGGRFVAALQRGAVLACQFHPELSGRWGRELLRRWLNTGDGGRPC